MGRAKVDPRDVRGAARLGPDQLAEEECLLLGQANEIQEGVGDPGEAAERGP